METLREQLKRYGQHTDTCLNDNSKWVSEFVNGDATVVECPCGWAKLRLELYTEHKRAATL